jgi:outer membrane immunogenic protein
MKKLLLASSALAFAGSAFAADLQPAPRMAVKAPVVAAVPFSWTGCYVGAEAGYGWGTKDFTDPFAVNFADVGQVVRTNVGGGLVGGQVGCNYQPASNWVLGIEGDIAWANITGSTVDPFFNAKNMSAKTDALAAVTGRVGYTWDRVMLYGKGGGAWARDRYDIVSNLLFPLDYQASETRFGWTVGAGVEWAFSGNWSAKLEYDYYDFGNRRNNLVNPVAGVIPADIRQRINVVKVGLNYNFWSSPAITARY